MKTATKIDQETQGIYDRAEALLNRAGVLKEETFSKIWNAFQTYTVHLLMDGYQERFILRKLEERAAMLIDSLKIKNEGVNDEKN